ncbi:MAG: hypothetical protein GY856_40615 [bacterium]|nr:hypothetical protein [bacterium]
MAVDYVHTNTANLYAKESGSTRHATLLWGDRVTVLERGAQRARVRSRGREGWVNNTNLGGEPLLELYFIDVGQGDGVLVRTPDHRHLLIDGGYNRRKQPTGKNAADFVDWKFARDYGAERIELEAMIASHCDADHYGGLWDLLNPDESHELDLTDVRVEAFYHAGVGWWTDEPGGRRNLGEHVSRDDGDYLSRLMGDRDHVLRHLEGDTHPHLQGEWAQFMRCVTRARKRNGEPTPIARLSADSGFVPGFDPESSAVSCKILAPVEFEHQGQPVIRRHGSSNSWNTNGNSLLLRLDYGRSRILLTGDLNSRSQAALLTDYEGHRQEFECDVAKSCHHGSDDVSYRFLQAMRPAVTVISSGDNEGHDHPRPAVVAASATTGFLELRNDRIHTPLVYSTELARSVSLGEPISMTVRGESGEEESRLEDEALRRIDIEFAETKAGDLRPRVRRKRLANALVVAGVIYGLVNVRTDGDRILCATMDEKDGKWKVNTIHSRF